ncbi:putative bifunctional diguanylate cyclase/phosphodiesterase [Rhodococcus sp. NBC_00294]|uniref:putative bifunctional diguanylate cyclase/phosphodiesterase n=1 Tax=Rhodococcus sp. NBC_00294 TaxID=2976004 RepID=UPI002E2E73D3|nr:EAL domain-containing protein [Rhodococcus sp. NBC_00294]
MIAVGITALGVALALAPGDHVFRGEFEWSYLLTPVIGAYTCFLAATRTRGIDRRFWSLMTASMAIWPVGQLMFIITSAAGAYTFPSWVEVPVVLSNTLTVAALVRYPRHGAAFTARNILDALMVSLSVGLITWHLWLRPLVENLGGAAELRSVAGLYFPIIGALQLTLGILALGRAKYRDQIPLTVIVLGLVLLAAGGIWYAQWQSDGSTSTSGFAFNMLGNLCTTLAPLLVFRAADRSRRARAVLYPTSIVPYIPAAAAVTVSVVAVHRGTAQSAELLVVLVLILMLSARQYAVLWQNNRLRRTIENTERQMRHRAHHDALTGLANRAHLQERLDQLTDTRGGTPSLLFIDLDDYKIVNDTLGHRIGDQVLVDFAARLRNGIRRADTIARLGGDEFVVLLDDVDEAASTVAARVLELLDEPFTHDGHTVTVSGSIGVVTHGPSDPPTTSEEMLARGDTAMLRAKRSGKGTVVEFDTGMALVDLDDTHLRAALTAAIERETLGIALQPIVDTATGRIRGTEALLRLTRGRTVADPLSVVAAASRGGILPELTSAVLQHTARRTSPGDDHPHPGTIHVNVLPIELDTAHLEASLRSVFDTGLLRPHQLVLEIAENAIAPHHDDVHRGIARMHALGVRIALDDFGSTDTSLSTLAALDVDIVKLAPALVDALDRLPRMTTVISSLVQMADSLGAVVIAEGVERPGQLDMLRHLGVPLAQGYLLGAPHLDTARSATAI